MLSVKLNLERSIVINKPISEVFAVVSDFNTWGTWSPWLIQEPECPVKITNEANTIGHSQRWDGNQIGSGNMAISSISQNESIHYDLMFLKPWKSQSKTSFTFEQIDGKTKITWTMKSTLPFFLFWMKKMMVSLIGSDYVRGLTMLKDLCETGSVHSSFDINANKPQQGFYYVGIKRECAVEKIGEIMNKDLQTLHDKIENKELAPAEHVIGIYEKFDMPNSRCQFISALTYKTEVKVNDSQLSTGYMPAHNSCIVNHTGEYKHLGNAWSVGMSYLRFNKIKQNKKLYPYEVYISDPKNTDSQDLKTSIHFPLQ